MKQIVFKNLEYLAIFIGGFIFTVLLNAIISIVAGTAINLYILLILYATIPFIIFAYYIRSSSLLYYLPAVIFSVILEKVFWLLLGYSFYIGSPDGKLINQDLMYFTQSEIVPFFSYYYIFFGSLISLTVVFITLRLIKYKTDDKSFS